MEQKNKSRSRVKVAFFCVVGIHVVCLMVLLMQGCKREQPQPPPETGLPTITEPNLPPMETNAPPAETATNVVAPIEPVPTTPPVQEYVIQHGDTFYSIGKKLHVPMKSIQDANPNVNPAKLQDGQKIIIPEVTTSPTVGGIAPGAPVPAAGGNGGQIYVVKSGDTLTKIATQHGTTVKALRSANNLKTDKIKVGDKLIIPAQTVTPAPAPAPMPVETYPAPTPSPAGPPPGQ